MESIFDLNQTSYWYPLIWIFAAGAVLSKMPKQHVLVRGHERERWYWIIAIPLVLPYILWAGYRTNFIDTKVYIYSFNMSASSLEAIPSRLASGGKDPGFAVLTIILKSLGVTSYHSFFMVIAAFQMVCMVYIFRKYSDNFWLSMFLFVTSTDYFSWMHNGIRQFIAVTMTFAAFELLVRRKYVWFALVVWLASTIHGSALLMLPFAYVMSGPALNRKTLLMIFGVALLVPFIDSFTPILENILADTQYSDMMTTDVWTGDNGTNPIRVLVYSVPALVALLGRKYIKDNRDPAINMCINASIITMAIYLVSSVTSGIYIGRVPIYTTLYGYMVLPWMLDRIFDKQSVRLIKLMMVVCFVGFYYYQMHIAWNFLK